MYTPIKIDSTHWILPVEKNGKVEYVTYDFSNITGSIDQVGWDPKK